MADENDDRRNSVFAVISAERDYQDRKWGTIHERPHEVGSWMTLMRGLLNEAELAWIRANNDRGALDKIRELLAVGVACMEQHGAVARVLKDTSQK